MKNQKKLSLLIASCVMLLVALTASGQDTMVTVPAQTVQVIAAPQDNPPVIPPAPVTLAPVQMVAAPAPVQIQTVAAQPATMMVTQAVQEDPQPMNRLKLLELQRQNAEVENEQILKERIEAGRLADEKARKEIVEQMQPILTGKPISPVQDGQVMSQAVVQNPIALKNPEVVEQVAAGSDTAVHLGVTVVGGKALVHANETYSKISNRGTAGLLVGYRMNRFFTLEGDFSYGLQRYSSNGYSPYGAYSYNYGSYGMNNYQDNSYEFMRNHQLTVGMNLKVNFIDYMVSPYVAGGIGYVRNNYVMSSNSSYYGMPAYNTMSYYNNGYNTTPVHTGFGTNMLAGSVAVGVDVTPIKNLTVGARVEYKRQINLARRDDNLYTSFYTYDPAEFVREFENIGLLGFFATLGAHF